MAQADVRLIPIFADISDAAAERVASGAIAEVPAGQVLAQAGDAGEGMFVVLEGSVVAERGDLHLPMGRNDFFGELALLVPGSPRIARVRAVTDSRILAVPRDSFEHLLATEPSVAGR